MLQKKICLLGSFAVGKSSLVKRFIHSEFSDRYITNLGVRVDTKIVEVNGKELTMLIWDVNGKDHFQSIRSTYIKGAAGYLMVIDGTRPETLEIAKDVQAEAEEILGKVPFLVLINKEDLKEAWTLSDENLQEMRSMNWQFYQTSAKSGTYVDEAFHELARQMVTAT